MDSEVQNLDGLWTYTAYEEDGLKRMPGSVATMAKFIILIGEYLPGWDGLWASIDYGYQGGSWSEEEARAACRDIILGGDRDEKNRPSDFYLWAGGRFRIAPGRTPKEIDFEQYWRGEVLPSSASFGIYSLNC